MGLTQSAATDPEDGQADNGDSRARSEACPTGCGRRSDFDQVRVLGRWYPPTVPACEACEAERAGDAEDAERRQASEERSRVRKSREANIHQLLARAGASPWEHGSATLDDFDQAETGVGPITAAWLFVGNVLAAGKYDPVRGIYFAGPTGAGKSHLATAIARELLLDPMVDPDSIVFDPADVLVSRIRSLYGGKGDVDALLRRRENARVWILDDLGREPPHPDVIGHLTMLISQRSQRGTVITGNLMPEEYEARHADLARIGSRLGPAYFQTVRVEGRDRRFDS